MNRFAALLAATGTTAALFLAAGPAAAQDRAPFTGPRAEVTVGYDSTRLKDQPAGVPDSVSQARIGVAAGYDWAIATNWRLGAEVGVGGTLGDGRDYTVGTSKIDIDQGRDLDAAVRLGYLVGDRTMVYGKAGWANSRYIGRVTTGNTTTRTASNEDGFRAGVGVEHMLNDKIYAKGEYRYTSYGNDVERHQLLAGLGYRF